MTLPLFRREAIDAARSRVGNPVRTAGVASWMLTVFLVALFFSIVAFLFLTRIARKEFAQGIVVPVGGALRVTSVRAGTVAAIHVTDGTTVSRGQPLLTVSIDTQVEGGKALGDMLIESSLREAQAQIDQAAAERELNDRRVLSLDLREQSLREDLSRFDVDIGIQRQRADLARRTVDETKSLVERKMYAAIQFRALEESALQSRQQLATLEREKAKTSSSLNELAAERRVAEAERKSTIAKAELAAAQLDEKRAAQQAERRIVLTSPIDGKVTALTARVGEAVVPNASLATVLPEDASIEVELWVPSRAIGFIRPGDVVRLMYDAFPYERFGVGLGKVNRVSAAPVVPQDLPRDFSVDEAMYRVSVALDADAVTAYGKSWDLVPGMRLAADIVLESRSFADLVLDPMRAAARRAGD